MRAVTRDPFGPPCITRMGGPTSDQCAESGQRLMTVGGVLVTAIGIKDRREAKRSKKALEAMSAMTVRLPETEQLQILDYLISPIANNPPATPYDPPPPEVAALIQYWMRGNGGDFMTTFRKLRRRPGIDRVIAILAIRAAVCVLEAHVADEG